MSREIVGILERPAHIGVFELYEDAGALPLDVHECIHDGAVFIEHGSLVVEDTHGGVPGRSVPLRIIPSVEAYLHGHHVLPTLIPLHHELDEPLEVQGEQRQRQHGLVGRGLQQHTVVQMQEVSYHEFFAERGAEHADDIGVLPGNRSRIVIVVIAHEAVIHVGRQLPVRNVQPGLEFGFRSFPESLVPGSVVGVEALDVVVGTAKRRTEASV